MCQTYLCVLLLLLLKCFRASSSNSGIIYFPDGDEKFTASLPEGSKDFNQFNGYFVELSNTTGCAKNLTVNHVKDGERNANNFVPYIDWSIYGQYTDPNKKRCTFDELVENLENIKISHFILVVDKHSNFRFGDFRQLNNVDFAMYKPIDKDDFNKFVSHVSADGRLQSIEVKEDRQNEQNTSIPMSSMAILFVTVAFVTLMTVSIGWLVFYYAQRCRQRNMRERLQSRLCVAAKRAVSKLPTKTIPDNPKTSKKSKKTPPVNDNASTCSSCSSDDGDFCPVCLDLYKPREVIRILPCKHEFHKGCVDPWLFDHRTCPMCKLDILEHLGMPPAGDRLTTPSVAMQGAPPDYSDHVSTRVDQEVQTDFVTQQPSHPLQTTVTIRMTDDDHEIGPAPISSPSV